MKTKKEILTKAREYLNTSYDPEISSHLTGLRGFIEGANWMKEEMGREYPDLFGYKLKARRE